MKGIDIAWFYCVRFVDAIGLWQIRKPYRLHSIYVETEERHNFCPFQIRLVLITVMLETSSHLAIVVPLVQTYAKLSEGRVKKISKTHSVIEHSHPNAAESKYDSWDWLRKTSRAISHPTERTIRIGSIPWSSPYALFNPIILITSVEREQRKNENGKNFGKPKQTNSPSRSRITQVKWMLHVRKSSDSRAIFFIFKKWNIQDHLRCVFHSQFKAFTATHVARQITKIAAFWMEQSIEQQNVFRLLNSIECPPSLSATSWSFTIANAIW